MLNFVFGIFIVYGILILVRILLGPTVWDRILGLNLFSAVIIILILITALIDELSYLVDVAIVYSLLGYVSIIFISRFVERKGKI